jgi:hypothetical protein
MLSEARRLAPGQPERRMTAEAQQKKRPRLAVFSLVSEYFS